MDIFGSILNLIKGGISNLLSRKAVAAIVGIVVTVFGLDISDTQKGAIAGLIAALWLLVTAIQAGEQGTPVPKLTWAQRIQALFSKEFIATMVGMVTTLSALPVNDAVQANIVAVITGAFLVAQAFINTAETKATLAPLRTIEEIEAAAIARYKEIYPEK
jgi:hypothetical protein